METEEFSVLFSQSISEFLPFFGLSFLNGQRSETIHDKRKVAQLKRQQFLSLDSQSITSLINYDIANSTPCLRKMGTSKRGQMTESQMITAKMTPF